MKGENLESRKLISMHCSRLVRGKTFNPMKKVCSNGQENSIYNPEFFCNSSSKKEVMEMYEQLLLVQEILLRDLGKLSIKLGTRFVIGSDQQKVYILTIRPTDMIQMHKLLLRVYT